MSLKILIEQGLTNSGSDQMLGNEQPIKKTYEAWCNSIACTSHIRSIPAFGVRKIVSFHQQLCLDCGHALCWRQKFIRGK